MTPPWLTPDENNEIMVQFVFDTADCQFCFREKLVMQIAAALLPGTKEGEIQHVGGMIPVVPAYTCLECIQQRFASIAAYVEKHGIDRD